MSTLGAKHPGPGAPTGPGMGASGPQRNNRWDWAPPEALTPPDVGPLAPTPSTPGRLKWTVEPVPVWPPAPGKTHGQTQGQTDGIIPLRGPRGGADLLPPPQPGGPMRDDHIRVDFAPPYRAKQPDPVPEPAVEPRSMPVPGPSRLTYRINRLWLTPGVRFFVRVGLPVLLVALTVLVWLSDEGRRQALADRFTAMRLAVETQPMFMVHDIAVTSRSPEVAEGVRNLLEVTVPVSSWHLDLQRLRDTAEALDAVETASVEVRDGVLNVRLQERTPAMVWRHRGGLDLVDAQGYRVARLTARAARADLPLIAGDGAPRAIAEARLLLASAQPWADRVRGLVRVGERRWDLVLASGQRVMLPADGALGALERVMALDAAQGLLSRDVTVIDMRLPARPTLRLTPDAAAALHTQRLSEIGAVRP